MFRPVDPNPDFAKLEEEILNFWEKEKIFEKSLAATESGKPFTFYDGPPFATGLPHYGHILASTIKDLIPRYQTMRGRYVRRRWGWDCHGLPIEEIVERKLGISGKKQIEEIGIKKFNDTCRDTVLTYVEEWGKMVRRMARWIDFDNSYKTMDREYMESVWWAFKQIYDKGLVYEGRKVLLYCPRCETPISNFEVAMDNSYQDVTEEAVTIKFKVTDPSVILSGAKDLDSSSRPVGTQNDNPTYLLAWTTTPWTLVGNVGLAVGEEIEYVVVEKDGENLIIAKKNLESGISNLDSKFEIRDSIKGRDLVGLQYEPLFDVPEIAANKKSYHVYAGNDFVNTEEGTGIVHTAVVYGEEDYALGIREGLPVVPLLDEKGRFNDKAPALVREQYFKDSEAVVKADLEKRGHMLEKKMHQHSYPHCWRCDTALFYNAIPAWFINIQKIKAGLLQSNEKEINWFPDHLKHGRYQKSVEAAPDWNISRNRYWGNPIPVWKCGSCGKDTVVGSIEELEEKRITNLESGISNQNSKFEIRNSIQDLHRPYIDEVILKCQHCGGEARRIPEIFDSWVEAASMPFAEFHYPFENKEVFESRLPAQFVAEYIAQTRAWFYVMHVMSFILFGKAPFENVVTTGTILAEDGSKMSKSKNNFPDPWTVINKYGVDSLRFYLMNSVVMDADNLNFSEKDLAVVSRKVFRILWNVYNYFVTYANQNLESRISNLDSKFEILNSMNILDHWLNARLQQTIGQVTKHLDGYDTVRATRGIESFIDDLSTWYLRRCRGRRDSEFFATLFRSLLYLAKLLSPIAPFMAEEIYRNLTSGVILSAAKDPDSSSAFGGTQNDGSTSVHLATWPEAKAEEIDEQLLQEMQGLRDIVEQAHALRAKAGIKLRQPLAMLTIPHNPPQSPLTLRGEEKASEPPSLRVRPARPAGGEGRGELRDSLLDLLKSEVNVKEVVYGDKLALDTELTPELKLAGAVAELTRQIQMLRKEQGLKIGEMAVLEYWTTSEMLVQAMERVDKSKVYVKELKSMKQEAREGKEVEVEGEMKIVIKLTK